MIWLFLVFLFADSVELFYTISIYKLFFFNIIFEKLDILINISYWLLIDISIITKSYVIRY